MSWEAGMHGLASRASSLGIALLLIAVAGCASTSPPVETADVRSSDDLDVQRSNDLTVRFQNDSPDRFVLNRPAYVAVFAIQPGQPVRVLQPSSPLSAERQRLLSANSHPLRSEMFASGGGGSALIASRWGKTPIKRPLPGCTGPRVQYRLVVASERPLDFDALDASVRFSSELPTRVSRASYQPHSAFESVIEALLPDESSAFDMTAARMRC